MARREGKGRWETGRIKEQKVWDELWLSKEQGEDMRSDDVRMEETGPRLME